MIRADGWGTYCIWEHSAVVKDLYSRRCLLQAEEMTCHKQAASLLARVARPGESVLDVGCGAGYFYHSIARRGLDLRYTGIDAAPSLVRLGQSILPGYGLPTHALQCLRLEDACGEVDHVVCLNVLTNIDNYHRPLERMLGMARRSVILRESAWDRPARYEYVRDAYLDPGVDLSVHVNTYNAPELMEFMRVRGFHVCQVVDVRTGGEPEDVIGYPHHWTFFVATRDDTEEAA